MGGWLRANGEGVYGTSAVQRRQNYTTAEGTLFYFTAAAAATADRATLFATATSWPGGRFALPLDGRPCPPPGGVALLGDSTVRVTPSCDVKGQLGLELGMPPANVIDGAAAMRHAWAFRLAW